MSLVTTSNTAVMFIPHVFYIPHITGNSGNIEVTAE